MHMLVKLLYSFFQELAKLMVLTPVETREALETCGQDGSSKALTRRKVRGIQGSHCSLIFFSFPITSFSMLLQGS